MKNFIDISVLHAYPLSNLNRDDLGSPKSANYGGAVRGRVSSQATKRPVRVKVEDLLDQRGVRTRRLPIAIANKLIAQGWQTGEAHQVAADVINAAGIDGLTVTPEGTTNSMLYVPEASIAELSEMCEKHRDLFATTRDSKKGKKNGANPELKEVQVEVRAIIANRNPGIAAFGRMLANSPESAVDGAIAVAHSVTTHAAPEQPDFFTAVDDLPGEDGGFAHGGHAALTSGTYYRYASINVEELTHNLDGDLDATRELIKAFLAEFAVTVPPAKRGSTAPNTPPAVVYCSVRSDQPVSLVGAFEAPVQAERGSGFTAPSLKILDRHAQAVHGFYGSSGILYHGHSGTADVTGVEGLGGYVPALNDLVERVTAAGASEEQA